MAKDSKDKDGKVIAEIKTATQASEEDIKSMLQLHNGDVNAATMALLENPFQKVDARKKEPKKESNVQSRGGDRDFAGPRGGRKSEFSGPPQGRGGPGGRGGGRSDFSGRGRGGGGGAPPSAGRGRGSSQSAFNSYSSATTYAGAATTYSSAASYDNGTHASGTHSSVPDAFGDSTSGSAFDSTFGASTSSASNAWGSSAPAASSGAPPAGAWGAGKKTMAEIIKSRQVAPPPATPKPQPIAAAAFGSSYEDAFGTTEPGEYVEPDYPEDDYAHQPEESPFADPVDEEEPIEEQHAHQPTWSNADAAKTLLNTLTKGPTAVAATIQAVPQPPAVTAVAQQEQILSAAADAVAVPSHYGSYGAAGALPAPQQAPGVVKAATTVAEIEAAQLETQSLQLSFGNFGLGDFGGATFNSYGATSGADSSSLMSAQPKQAAPGAPEQSQAQAQQDAYKTAAASYNNYAYGAEKAPQAQGQAQASYSNFGQGSNFGASFGSGGFGSAPTPDVANTAFDAAQHAFANYNPEALKQQQQQAYGNPAPGMAAYGMQQQQQYAQYGMHAGQPQAAKPGMYYGQTPAQGQQGQLAEAPAPAPASSAAASSAAAASAATTTGPAGMPAPAVPSGMPAMQAHFGAPQGAASGMAPGMAPYGNGLYNGAGYSQFGPAGAPYMNYGGYGAMGYNAMAYQGVSGYPPQAAAFAPNNSYGAAAPQHGAPRGAAYPYSNPGQAAGPGSQIAPGAYGAAVPTGNYLSGYEDMSASGAGGISSYGMSKDKDNGAGMYASQGQAQGGYQGGYQNRQYYPTQGYNNQQGYGVQQAGGGKGNYGGGYRQQGGYNQGGGYNASGGPATGQYNNKAL